MSAPLWPDARIHQQAIAYSGYISSVVKALTEMRDEYEATLLEREISYAVLRELHQQLVLELKTVRGELLAAKNDLPF